jgi:hypothetical protein
VTTRTAPRYLCLLVGHPWLQQVYDFLWNADDRLRTVQEAGVTRFSALYDGDGLRVQKSDTRSGVLQSHNYSYGPGGLMHEDNPTTVYTPGFGHRSNGISSFYQTDWLGSTRYLTDSTGNNWTAALGYDAFGNRSATGGTDPYHSTDMQYAGGWGYQTEWASSTEPGWGWIVWGFNFLNSACIGRGGDHVVTAPLGLWLPGRR